MLENEPINLSWILPNKQKKHNKIFEIIIKDSLTTLKPYEIHPSN